MFGSSCSIYESEERLERVLRYLLKRFKEVKVQRSAFWSMQLISAFNSHVEAAGKREQGCPLCKGDCPAPNTLCGEFDRALDEL